MNNTKTSKKLSFLLIVFLVIFSLILYIAKLASSSYEKAKSIILIIGDGMGLPIITAYDYYKSEYKKQGYSNFSRFDGSFLVRTRSEDHVITDSAAGATAFAIGRRVPNYQLGMMENRTKVPTIMDIAKQMGKSTGIVVECSLTHATPAAFYSYSESRSEDDNIAKQFIYSNIDIAIGGGFETFKPYIKHLEKMGYMIIYGEEKLIDIIKSNKYYEKFILFTAKNHPPKYTERKVHLDIKTEYAISMLSRNKNGFFLMIEASQIDWYGHENKLPEQLDEMEDLDKLLNVVLSYYQKNPNTLVMVISDHDCGGLTLIDKEAKFFSLDFKINYGSDYHTAEHTIGFYKGSIKVNPIIDNTEIYKVLYEYMKQ